MRTIEQVCQRIRWDARFDPARFLVGVRQRDGRTKTVPLEAFAAAGDIPWHRVGHVEADGVVVWDRAAGVDLLDTLDVGRRRDPRRLRAPFFAAVTPYAWRPADGARSGGWLPAEAPLPDGGPGTAAPTDLRVLTWNTLWDRYDADRIDTARRRPLLLAALAAADADVIALQEVEPALLAMLLDEPWVRARYTVGTDPGGRDVDAFGLLVLSRLPVLEAGSHVLGPHKAVAAVTLRTAGTPLTVAAVHLSSDHSPDGAARREAELARLAEGLAGVEGDVLLLGDFNDGRSGAAGPAAALGLRDAWSQVHGPADDTATFDPVANPLAAVSSLSGRAARLDRVLHRTADARVTAAALLGDRPAPDGLYPSDHYGVAVDLRLGGAADGAEPEPSDGAGRGAGVAVDATPTARTAVAWIPPEELWPPIQELRAAYDPQLHRWPPHVNLLFGFVPESLFDRALPLVGAAAAEVAPFTAQLAGVHTFGHREDATLWLDPAAADGAPWAALRHALERRFPGCRGRAEGFTPHLTLGRSSDPQAAAADCATRLPARSARVGELVVLSRRGDEPMRPRAVVELGTGVVRPWPEAAADDARGRRAPAGAAVQGPAVQGAAVQGGAGYPRAEDPRRTALARRLTERIAQALPEGAVHLVGSRRLDCHLDGADLDLVAAVPGAADPAELRARITAALPEARRVREVRGARVPGLRLAVDGLDVDLVVVSTGGLDPAEAVDRRAELGEAAAIALSAVGDAEALLAAVDGRRDRFARLAREVKAWARARGLDSAPFGQLPSLAWSVLAARTVRDADDLPADGLFEHFLATWAAWDWRTPVALSGAVGGRGQGPVTVLTPAAPVRSCTAQVGPGGLDLLTEELYRAWEVAAEAAGAGTDPWPALLAPPPLHRRHAAWAVVTVEAPAATSPGSTSGFEEALGAARGRIRALLTALEEAGAADVHAWPRPFGEGPGLARFAVGLGRTPPGADALAAVTTGWCRGLPGVRVDRVEGGGVPTLR
ncbi:RNA repair domain-containing protein [Kitasatospora sp. NPDC090091]|uniref:RNA repair domain-containing protein n=1 Tax=Kitasatospora sp. NPDC090091 TaxID=3364081 RepID=UPI00380979F6